MGAGLRSPEHVKRFTTIGTANDQGRTSGVLTLGVLAGLIGAEMGSVRPTTHRPPAVPVPFSLLAGRDRGVLSDPVRTTAIHSWHVAHGAVFEDVGQWKRPWYYPRGDEDMDAAVLRECRAAREGVGVMDASTLGKIDVQGPDAAEFLNRLYTGDFAKLGIGRCKYGILCTADGMLFDDGVHMRLADDRYLVTTTTGNAAAVLDWFEEWLQTEWPELRVHCTSVTEQWATVAVVGPRSRDVLAALAPDLDVSAESFRFMDIRDGGRRGDPGARLPHLLLRRARLRDQRARVGGPRDLGGGDGRRRAARHHALRDGDDARPARREGLRDRRAGDRRHGDAAGRGPRVDDRQGQARLRRQALAPAGGRACAPTASSSSRSCPRCACRRARSSCSRRAARWWGT